jgi:hypothetical protein
MSPPVPEGPSFAGIAGARVSDRAASEPTSVLSFRVVSIAYGEHHG